ncbi:MAG: lysophospholipid acyltransferase family protein [Planctomycetota bacterium]
MSGAVKRARWHHWIVYALARLAIGAAARMPQAIGYGLAGALGRLYFRCSRRRRECALRFLRAAFPDEAEPELLRIGRVATGNVFKVPIDMARLTRLLARGGHVREVVDLTPLDGLLPAPPYLGVTAHLGSWEVAAVTMAQLSGEGHGVARVSKNPLLQRWILHNRRRGGLVIHPRRGGIQGLASAMARGKVGLQVVDQHQRLRGVIAPFFGRDASCERAAASLALRRGYPIVVGGAVRTGRGFRFRIVSAAPFVPQKTGDRECDLRNVVIEINRRLEEQIRAHREQYLWIHDRYRAQRAEPG